MKRQPKADFDKLNETLCTNAYRANMYSGMMGPRKQQLGLPAICAGGGRRGLLMSRGGGIAVGALMSFLLLTRSFNQPISQVSNQINAIVMALAGAERIFELMDESPEEDAGYVTLVNARRRADGSLEECPEHTGPLGVEAPPQGGRDGHLHRLAGRHHHVPCGFCLRAGQTGTP